MARPTFRTSLLTCVIGMLFLSTAAHAQSSLNLAIPKDSSTTTTPTQPTPERAFLPPIANNIPAGYQSSPTCRNGMTSNTVKVVDGTPYYFCDHFSPSKNTIPRVKDSNHPRDQYHDPSRPHQEGNSLYFTR